MGPTHVILAFRTKIYNKPKTQQNVILAFQTKTHIGLGMQPCNISIPKLKHTLNLGPKLAILAFQN
jgi:hypothetical protein